MALLQDILSFVQKKKPVQQSTTVIPQRTLDQNKLEILRKNVVAQTPYTPVAQQNINNMELYAYGNRSTGRNVSSAQDLSGGEAGDMALGVHRDTLDIGGPQAIDVFRHESLHNMDNNTYGNSDPTTPNNSIGLSRILEKLDPSRQGRLLRMLRSNSALYRPDQHTNDVESYAYFGSDPSRVFSAPKRVQPFYQNVYIPMSLKPLNYSPMFPTQETLDYEQMLTNPGWVRPQELM